MGTPGRDHWGNSMFCLMGGGGVKGGQIVGSTDRLGERPAHAGPSRRANIHATIYHVLGIDPKLQLLDPSGRPVNVLDDPSRSTSCCEHPSLFHSRKRGFCVIADAAAELGHSHE